MQYLPLVSLFLGLILIAIALFYRSKKSKLKKTGIAADGIIFRHDKSYNYLQALDDLALNNDKIIVRFTTLKKEWVTQEISQDFQFYYTGQYRDGESIKIYYDEQNPLNFYVDTKQSEIISRIFFAIIGLVFIIYGLVKLLN